jgi:hypothetical protein
MFSSVVAGRGYPFVAASGARDTKWLPAILQQKAHSPVHTCVQYASFQDKHHLYFLFDLLPGGDLMDILVAEAKVIKHRTSDAPLQMACLAPKTKILKVKPTFVTSCQFSVGT